MSSPIQLEVTTHLPSDTEIIVFGSADNLSDFYVSQITNQNFVMLIMFKDSLPCNTHQISIFIALMVLQACLRCF